MLLRCHRAAAVQGVKWLNHGFMVSGLGHASNFGDPLALVVIPKTVTRSGAIQSHRVW